ncbi:sigma-70 family RNA polymerase sigma factor [Bacillaceae bacterium]
MKSAWIGKVGERTMGKKRNRWLPSVGEADEAWESRSFTELYDEYFPKVNRYLRSRVPNYWDADDLTTAVFLKALENFHQYDRSRSFGAWIFRIAHNTYVDYIRKKRELPMNHEEWLADEVDPTWQPEERTVSKEESTTLQRMMEQLTEDQRDVLLLRYFGELKISQVAEAIGKSESAIKMIARRALMRLRGIYERGNES